MINTHTKDNSQNLNSEAKKKTKLYPHQQQRETLKKRCTLVS